MAGRPRTPDKIKELNGTLRNDRRVESVELDLCADVPAAPNWLPNAHAVKEWNRLAPILHKVGLLTEGGVTGLAHICALHGKLVQLWAAGESPNGSMMSQYRGLINDYGLTPVAQGKVKAGAKPDTGNKFLKNGTK